MPDHVTARRGFPYPDLTGKVGGPTGVGAVDTEELAKAMDALDTGYAGLFTAGLQTYAEWNFGTFTINSGTAALSTTLAGGGIAWFPDPSIAGALIRSVTPATKPGSTVPSSLPASGKFMPVCLELIAPSVWGGPVTFAVTPGVQKTTLREAELSLPAQTAGRIRYSWVIIKNTAGVYSIPEFEGFPCEGTTFPVERYEEPPPSSYEGVIKGGSWAHLAPLAGPVGPKTIVGPAYVPPGISQPLTRGTTEFWEPNPLRPTLVTVITMQYHFKYKARLLLKEAEAGSTCKVIAEWTFRNYEGTKRCSKHLGFICPAGAKWALYFWESAETVNYWSSYLTL